VEKSSFIKNNELNIILPFRGEFGMKLIHHVPIVHSIKCENKIVVCEIGEESLYPTANEYILCDRRNDELRRDTSKNDKKFLDHLINKFWKVYGRNLNVITTTPSMSKSYFKPHSFSNILLNQEIDIVICPRKRKYGEEKNWHGWKRLSEILIEKYNLNVFAIGAPDSSYADLHPNCMCSWDYKNFLDVSITAINSSKLVISTDSGLAHLSVWCGQPLLLISYEDGKIAPGPVKDGQGRIVRNDYWKINMKHYMSENHLASPINIIHNAWNDFNIVENSIVSFLKIN
jgi:hypothetical protein